MQQRRVIITIATFEQPTTDTLTAWLANQQTTNNQQSFIQLFYTVL